MRTRAHRPTRRINIRLASLSIAATAAVALSFYQRDELYHFYDRAHNRVSDLMRLEQMTWEEVGSSNLSNRLNQNLLWGASGLKLGQEMLSVDMPTLEKRLMSLPWLESVQIQKKLPSTILVRYTAYHARAVGVRKGKLWLISESGNWIAPVEKGDTTIDLPLLVDAEAVPAGIAWLDAIENELGSMMAQVHEVNISSNEGSQETRMKALIELQYQSQTIKLAVLAGAKPSSESLLRLKKVVQYLINNNILVSTIDLRLGKKVVVNIGRSP